MAKFLELDDVNRLIGEMLTGLSILYDLGSERVNVGRLIGDRPISRGNGEGSLYDLMQDGKGVFLDASIEGMASRLVSASTPRIRFVTVETGPSMLIRPDACIAWVGEENNSNGLEEALRCWFNPPLDDGSMVRSEP